MKGPFEKLAEIRQKREREAAERIAQARQREHLKLARDSVHLKFDSQVGSILNQLHQAYYPGYLLTPWQIGFMEADEMGDSFASIVSVSLRFKDDTDEPLCFVCNKRHGDSVESKGLSDDDLAQALLELHKHLL